MCLVCSAKLAEGCMGRTEPIPPGGNRGRVLRDGGTGSVGKGECR